MILKYDYLIIMSYLFNQLEHKMDLLFRKMNYICELLESQTMDRRPSPLHHHHTHPQPHHHSHPIPTPRPTTTTRPTNTEETVEFSFVTPDIPIPIPSVGITPSIGQNFLSNLLNPRPNMYPPAATGVTLNEIRTNTELHAIDSESDGEETCSICRGNYFDNNIARTITGCEHQFHSSCLDNWLSRNRTCPLCRGNVVQLNTSASASASS